MRHRIAPQPSLPEFYVEVGYLTDFSLLWKMRKLNQSAAQGELDVEFLARWYHHRQALSHYCHMIGFNPHNVSRDVKPCLEFVDALVKDWILELSGKTPELPLDTARLETLNQYTRKLESIPGEKWEIKY